MPGSMHDYSGPMHAAASDLMAFTGHSDHAMHHPSAALLPSPYESAPVKSESLQGLNPPVCYHESLPTQFLPLNLEINKQSSAQLDCCQPPARLVRHAHARCDSPRSARGGADGSHPEAWGEPPPDGLPAVERYSKMVANVLQVICFRRSGLL